MKVLLNTDNHIQHDESLAEYVETAVIDSLSRFRRQVMRVEVHLSDTNAGKSGAHDKQCTLEARLEGRQPVAVTEQAQSVRDAINGAARKLQRVLDSSLGKLAH